MIKIIKAALATLLWLTLLDPAVAAVQLSAPSINSSLPIAAFRAGPANPSGNASGTPVMMGLAGLVVPQSAGPVVLFIEGDVYNSSAIADGATLRFYYGSTALTAVPVNGGAVAGAPCGVARKYVASTTAGTVPFTVSCVVSGAMTPGLPYWFDLAVANVTGGTATVENIKMSAFALGPPQSQLIQPAYYVSPTGNDSNAGTLAAPFLTLTKCQTAMQASGTILTCYLRAGDYAPAAVAGNNCTLNSDSCGVALTTSDNGETWATYPPDGYGAARITGGSTASGNGLNEIFGGYNVKNVTFNGLTMHHFDQAGVLVNGFGGVGNATGIVFINNTCHDQFYVYASGAPGGCLNIQNGATNTVYASNAAWNFASNGYGLISGGNGGDISNAVIMANYWQNTCSGANNTNGDCGTPYIFDGSCSGGGCPSINILIVANYGRDLNTYTADLGTGAGTGPYLDNCTSNVTLAYNVFAGQNGSTIVRMHGGNNNKVFGNILDLATFNQWVMAYQTVGSGFCSAGTMSGNSFNQNIIMSSGGGGQYVSKFGSAPTDAPSPQGTNYYCGYGSPSTAPSHSLDYTDGSPVTCTTPGILGWSYQVAAGGEPFSSALAFQGIVGQWGPPGFQIPHVGTAPSSPSTF